MNEDIKKDRSRNYPKLTLVDAIELVKKLYSKAGKAKFSPEVAVGALGYSGLNGAALGALGTLTSYGLVDRERGKSVSVSSLAIKLIHPLNPEQETAAKREASLLPQVFKELFTSGFHRCDESLIANHLIQNSFTPDGAKKAASVFKANAALAKLEDAGINVSDESDSVELAVEPKENNNVKPDVSNRRLDDSKSKNMLATYSIPLGGNEATLVFSGQSLSTEDFDALVEYVQLFKKQFERKLKSENQKKLEEIEDHMDDALDSRQER